LANEARSLTSGIILCVSTPTIFVALKTRFPNHTCFLLEYDPRFANTYPLRAFTYDYRVPEAIPEHLIHAADVVVVDPPFLSEECLVKMARTVQLVKKDIGAKVILCTGGVMKETAFRELDVQVTTFRPQHKGGLANDYRCYTNYESDIMVWET